MKKQRGFSLIVVLSIVSVSLMLVLASVQSSLVDERLAGNFRAAALAGMLADSGVAWMDTNVNLDSYFKDFEEGEVVRVHDLVDGGYVTENEASLIVNSGYGVLEFERGEGDTFISRATYNDARRHVRATYEDSPGANVARGMLSCEDISIGGSAYIDAYDSRLGSYGGSNSQMSNWQISTQKEGANIVTGSSSKIYGNIQSSGGFQANNSATVEGDVYAVGDVSLNNGGYKSNGDIRTLGSVDFASSAKVYGNIEANGELFFRNWSAEVFGNVVAEDVKKINSSRDVIGQNGHIKGSVEYKDAGLESFDMVGAVEDCDVHGVANVFSTHNSYDFSSSGELDITGSDRNIVLGSDGYYDPVGGISYPVYEQGGHHVIKLDSFKLGGSARFNVGEVGSPVNMVMVVAGDIEIGGGGRFNVADGSTLTIITDGKFTLASGVQFPDNQRSPVVRNKNDSMSPVISLISSFDDRGLSQPGVEVKGSSTFYGEVVSPYSRLSVIEGADFYGAANARSVMLDGNKWLGGFHYDLAFEGVEESVLGGGGAGGFRLITWN